MQQKIFETISNRRIAEGIYELVLAGDTADITVPGQFVQLSLPGFFLRRPISVCNAEDGRLTLLYKVVGTGTEAMAQLGPGARLDVLTGLGNGFDLSRSGEKPLLAGGGIGAAPMYMLARQLCAAGREVTAVLGCSSAPGAFYIEEFRALGARVIVTTNDGSLGLRGFVTDGMRQCPGYSFVYACGPMPMLQAAWEAAETDGQFSFEERMGCGFGACMGCTRETKNGPKRICKDGPVLDKEEILW